VSLEKCWEIEYYDSSARVFDRHPNLKIIVGRTGELLPYCFTRLTEGLMAGWLLASGSKNHDLAHTGLRNILGDYSRKDVFITSSGVFDSPVFSVPKQWWASTTSCSPLTTNFRTTSLRRNSSVDAALPLRERSASPTVGRVRNLV
jgi:hypothetical protein